MKRIFLLGAILLFMFSAFSVYGQDDSLSAFPGAEGFGKYTTGGRGGEVIYVTTLEDNSSKGSLRYAVSQSGARIVMFKVSGTIELEKDLKIANGNITIAGQTAPGDGICIRSAPVKVTSLNKTTYDIYGVTVSASNVIIRYVRFRPGDEVDNTIGADPDSIKFETDAIFGRDHENIIIDHCSMSWSTDETASFYDNENFTMQWCLVSESLYAGHHPKGNHGYGGIWGGEGATFHHNMLADHYSRNPRFCGSRYTNKPEEELVDFRNNVIYNWGGNSVYGAEGGSYNMINNYYKAGPATSSSKKARVLQADADGGSNNQEEGVHGTFYIDGNYITASTSVTADNWAGVTKGSNYLSGVTKADLKSETPYTVTSVTTHSAEDAYEKVLDYVGASLVRDTVDKRVIYDARNGVATITDGGNGSTNGIIDTQDAVGGWPELNSTEAPDDTDEDGMPDDWETANGLDPSSADDAQLTTVDGTYPNVEVYLYSLVADITEAEYEGGIESAVEEIKTSAADVTVYFNKSAGLLNIYCDNNIRNVKVYSITGAMVKNVDLNQKSAQVDMSGTKEGIYIVRVVDEKSNVYARKAIVSF